MPERTEPSADLTVLKLPNAHRRTARKPRQGTCSQLPNTVVPLVKARWPVSVLVFEITRHTGAFPRQLAGYFRRQAALFGKAVCCEMLYMRQQAKGAAFIARTMPSLPVGTRALATGGVACFGWAFFMEVLARSCCRRDWAPLNKRTLDRSTLQASAPVVRYRAPVVGCTRPNRPCIARCSRGSQCEGMHMLTRMCRCSLPTFLARAESAPSCCLRALLPPPPPLLLLPLRSCA